MVHGNFSNDDDDYSTPSTSGGSFRYPTPVGPSTNLWAETRNKPVASSANGLDDRVRQSHIDPRLLIVDQQPKSGYAGLFCRGTSFQIPRGRVGRFPYYQINAVSRWGAYTGTAAGVRVSGTVTEGEGITGQKRPRVPEGTPRGGRKNEQCDMLQLRHLVMRWKGFDELPCSNEALALSYLYIRTVRPAVYPSSRLIKAKKESQNQKETYKAVKERERRQVDSRLFRALSRYYRLERKMEIWNRPQLLREVLEDLEDRYPPPELTDVWV